jgi:hypothetical protein
VDDCEECAEPASAIAGNGQAGDVNLDGTQNLGASDECKEIHDVLKDIVSCTGREEPIVCGDNCDARCGHAL